MGKLTSPNSNNENIEEASDQSSGSSSGRYRWVCWKLEERGFVGETALHICFLLSTPTHMILAQKLLTMFPMLINDIYTCDEYFGESSLVGITLIDNTFDVCTNSKMNNFDTTNIAHGNCERECEDCQVTP